MQLDHLEYHLNGQLYKLAYWMAGDSGSDRLVVCVHGLLRHSRDFDELAAALSTDALVVCPDLPGRGLSDWLAEPEFYRPEAYLSILQTLLARFPSKRVDWVGTSLGGLIGMGLAASEKSRIDRLILNDIGPELPAVALKRISETVEDLRFLGLSSVTEYLQQRYSSYQNLTDRQWLRLSRYGSRGSGNAQLALHYDPAIALNAQTSAVETIKLWPVWEQIEQPVLLFHGLDSDLLTTEIVEQMQSSHEGLSVVSLPGVAHAPSLMEPDHLNAITDWFSRN